MKKKLIIKRRSQTIKRSKTTFDKRLMHTLTVAVLFIAAFSHKAEVRADNGGGDVLGYGILGTAVGGLAGGRRGAVIGAGAGLGLGLLSQATRSSSSSDPYRKLNRLESKLDKPQTKADRYRADINNATSERRRERAEKRLNRTNSDIETTQNQINRMK